MWRKRCARSSSGASSASRYSCRIRQTPLRQTHLERENALGTRLNDADEGLHPAGGESNWNESRYIDLWDARQRVGGWFRMGQRPNEGHAEMSACVNLPDGR